MEGREEVVPSSRRQKKIKETQESLRPEVDNKRLIMMTMPRSFNIVTIAERRLQWFEHVERRHQASIMQKVLLLGEGERRKTTTCRRTIDKDLLSANLDSGPSQNRGV